MKLLIFFPFLIQAILIFLDEWYFHRRRTVPKFERVGHPLDTISFLFCLILVTFLSYTTFNLYVIALSSLFSCIFITKDEFVHKSYCCGKEMWLHACLFINHRYFKSIQIYHIDTLAKQFCKRFA